MAGKKQAHAATLIQNTKPPQPRTIRRYADALGVSEAFLKGEANIEAELREVAPAEGPPVTVSCRRPATSPTQR